MKKSLKLLLPLFILATFIYSSGCKEDILNNPITITNPDVKVYRNITINEFITASSLSSIDLYNGVAVDANNAVRDAELADSTAIGSGFDRFYVRSGDGTYDPSDAPGQETKFVPFFNTRNTAYSQAAFDTITYIGAPGNLVASDFYRYSLYSLGRSFTSTDVRVYGFWLKGKRASLGLSNEVYGLIYLKAIPSATIGSDYQLVVDVKINTKGLNDFRETIPAP